jgi:hypothetical protein
VIAVNQPGLPPQCARIHCDINGRLAMGTHLVSPNDKPEWLCCNCAESAQRKDLNAAIEFVTGRERTDAEVAARHRNEARDLAWRVRDLELAILKAASMRLESGYGRWLQCPFCDAMSDNNDDWAEWEDMPPIQHEAGCVVLGAAARKDPPP